MPYRAKAPAVGAPSRPASAALTFATPTTCSIQMFNTRNFLTAVGGGGRTTDVIHSDATQVQAWELFLFNCF